MLSSVLQDTDMWQSCFRPFLSGKDVLQVHQVSRQCHRHLRHASLELYSQGRRYTTNEVCGIQQIGYWSVSAVHLEDTPLTNTILSALPPSVRDITVHCAGRLPTDCCLRSWDPVVSFCCDSAVRQFSIPPHVRILHLRSCRAPRYGEFKHIRINPPPLLPLQLWRFSIWSAATSVDLTALSLYEELRELNLRHLDQTSTFAWLSTLPRLQSLNVWDLAASHFHHATFAGGVASIQSLRVSSCRVLTMAWARHLFHLTALELRFLPELTDLEALRHLGHNLLHLTLVGCTNVSGLPDIPSLLSVSVSCSAGTPQGFKLRGLSQLTSIKLQETSTLDDYSFLAGCSRLQTIDFQGVFGPGRSHLRIGALLMLHTLRVVGCSAFECVEVPLSVQKFVSRYSLPVEQTEHPRHQFHD
jgi:hypothetical protein